MDRQPIKQLAGMRDLPEVPYHRLKLAQDRLQRLFALHDYRGIDTPLLEKTELFLRKSGGEMGVRLYNFTDHGGGRVSLRPEFTSSIIRYYIQAKEEGPLPLRWRYAGPVFRFEPITPGVSRQFTQVGVELLGASGPESDAEILALGWHGLSDLGLSNHQLQIGHIGVIHGLLRGYNLSERARDFLVDSITQLASGDEGRQRVYKRGIELGLLDREDRRDLKANLKGLDDEAAQNVLRTFLNDEMDSAVGRRTVDEILHRFLRKVRGADDTSKVEEALNLLSQLAQVRGSPEEALEKAKAIARGHGLGLDPFAQVERLFEALGHYGLEGPQINLDFGLARGIAYYSGVIFEILHPQVVDGGSLGGGGRYDGLVKALGGPDEVPALGFAYNLERVLEVLDDAEEVDDTLNSRRTLLTLQSPQAYPWALRLAQELRSMNRVVRLGPVSDSLEESLSYAGAAGMDMLVVVDEKGQSKEYSIQAEVEGVATSRPK